MWYVSRNFTYEHVLCLEASNQHEKTKHLPTHPISASRFAEESFHEFAVGSRSDCSCQSLLVLTSSRTFALVAYQIEDLRQHFRSISGSPSVPDRESHPRKRFMWMVPNASAYLSAA